MTTWRILRSVPLERKCSLLNRGGVEVTFGNVSKKLPLSNDWPLPCLLRDRDLCTSTILKSISCTRIQAMTGDKKYSCYAVLTNRRLD